MLSSVGFDGTDAKGTLTLKDTNTTITSNTSATTSNTLDVTLTNSNLKLSGNTNTLTSLSANSNSTIDISDIGSRGRSNARHTLTIDSYKQNSNAKFIVYADSKNADKVVFNATNGNKPLFL